MKKKIIFKVLNPAIVVLFLCLCGCSCLSTSAPPHRSTYFTYSGYSEQSYKNSTKSSRFVAMRDGVKLAVDVYLPADGPQKGAFPTVFVFTPYGRALINPKLGKIVPGHFETQKFLSYGYAVVIADFRGTGASFGTFIFSDLHIGKDAREIIDWIAGQPWCDGNVGMIGQSFVGYSQLAAAGQKPKALKAIIPEVINFEVYSETIRPGGIFLQNWVAGYNDYLGKRNLNAFDGAILPAAPVIDEDGDGELADEIPVMTKGDPTTFLDDGPPTYADGIARNGNFYYLATLDHTKNMSYKLYAENFFYWDTADPAFPDQTARKGSSGALLRNIADAGIPVLHLGGWFDGYTTGTMKLHATLAPHSTSRLVMAPRFHIGMPSAYREYFSYSDSLYNQLFVEKLRFLDRYLKNIQNGIDRQDPVFIYVMNKGWRAEKEWPLARQRMTDFFFSGGHRLSNTPATGGADDYRVDFTHSSAFGSNHSSRLLLVTTPDRLMIRTALDLKTLNYDTPPLEAEVEVTGHPIIHLWVSSNRKDGDFHVYLTDVDEKGQSLYVTEGRLRAGWKNLQNADDQVAGGFKVLPELPWHGYAKDQYVNDPLADKRIVKLEFDLMPTSWVFKKGHKIRVAIAGADTGNFELNPVLALHNQAGEALETTMTVHRTAAYPSKIILPVIQ